MDNGRSQVAQTAFLYALVGWDFGGVALLEHPGKYFVPLLLTMTRTNASMKSNLDLVNDGDR